MNNLVADRIRNSQNQNVIQSATPMISQEIAPEPVKEVSPAINPDVLRAKLEEKLNPQPQIITEERATESLIPPQIMLVHFANLFEFAQWYENNQQSFLEPQRKALDTLLEARKITMSGCNCDREKRKIIAQDYFRKFWVNNKSTDLLPTLQKVLATKKIIFGDFLSYPE